MISHELNNSLAPIASLAHSGAELLRRERTDRLGTVFETIEERARHLEGFIRGYARFAKLPQPQLQTIEWAPFLQRLQQQIPFQVQGTLTDVSSRIDAAQIEQALLNLLKMPTRPAAKHSRPIAMSPCASRACRSGYASKCSTAATA